MEAGILQFDPATEFEIVETLDFEEEVQRPEELRFFTLDEQLNDYFDKVLPKKKTITKFEYKQIGREVDRLRELYEDTVTVTDTDYKVDLSRKKINVPWVTPIYSDFEYSAYSFAESWTPLYDPTRRRVPNYYPQLLTALPKPYRTTGADGVAMMETTHAVDEDGKKGINVMGIYERTKGVHHDDGSFSIMKLPILNTADDIKRKGFYLSPRTLEVPNPLAEHPFLASNGPSKVITNEPLLDVFPTMEAIMTHGVPKTNDPYVEGKKFLKLYDVKLSQIPWNLWSQQFPPVNSIVAGPNVISVTFPDDSDQTTPSKSLQTMYAVPWSPGWSPRFWLMKQEDAGLTVTKLLLTKAGDAGLVPPDALGDRPVPALPKSTPEECFTSETFDSFLNSGIYRLPPWSEVSGAVDKSKPIPVGICVPTTVIAQERANFISQGRIAWKETAAADILKDHKELLDLYQYKPEQDKAVKYEKYEGRPESELRKDIVALLKDDHRTDSDKAEAIELIIRGIVPKNNLYLDGESFVVCAHTLAILKGDLADDRLKFYEDWTAIDGGFRSCKSCGEQINADVLVAQDDFDDQGNALVNYEALGTGSEFHGNAHVASFTNSLNQLKAIFMLQLPAESILYLLLSLFQILPEETQLLPVLQNIRDITAILRANKKIAKETRERTEGVLGLVGMVIILQTHNPFLIPRRSFGSKTLRLNGFPRDNDDPMDCPALDTVLSVLKTTFQSTPNAFDKTISSILRPVISKPKEVKKEAVPLLKQAATKFKVQVESARARYQAPPEAPQFIQVSFPMIPVTKTEYKTTEGLGTEVQSECKANITKTFLTGRLPPSVKQEPEPLLPGTASKLAEFIEGKLDLPTQFALTDADLRAKVKLGFPKDLKLPKLEAYVRSDVDGVSVLTLMNRILDVLSHEAFPLERIANYRSAVVYLQTRTNEAVLRDSARGILFELLHEISDAKNKSSLVQLLNTASQRDLVMNMILLDEETASKQDRELRARERETFKQRMRAMNDTERTITKMLLDIGIAPYVITTEDREIFAQEYRLPDPEDDYTRAMQEVNPDRPEDGYGMRDINEGDDAPVGPNGEELEVDNGAYGERAQRPYDDYQVPNFDFDEGYGV